MFFATLLADILAFLPSMMEVPQAILNEPIQPTIAQCHSPSVRREWRSLSSSERADWISGVNCLAKLPHDEALTPTFDRSYSRVPPINSSSSYYDDLVYVHMDLNFLIHNTGFFLPWHRWYVQAFEDSLRSKCGYTGVQPYWNWTLDIADVYHSSMFDPDPQSGLGTWGEEPDDFTLHDGGLSSFSLSYPIPHILRRNYTLQPWFAFPLPHLIPDPALLANSTFAKSEISHTVNNFVGDFSALQLSIERFQGYHVAGHGVVGGDLAGMCPRGSPPDCIIGQMWSSNDPIFFLHHATVDKIWADWQNAHPSNLWAYEGGRTPVIDSLENYEANPSGTAPWISLDDKIPTDGMSEEFTIREVMDTTSGPLCYVYE